MLVTTVLVYLKWRIERVEMYSYSKIVLDNVALL